MPEDLGRLFLERARAGDVEGVVALYEPGAVLATPTGEVVRGTAALRDFYTALLAGPRDRRRRDIVLGGKDGDGDPC